jgi:nucleoside-diphosphate-sugar epimerase
VDEWLALRKHWLCTWSEEEIKSKLTCLGASSLLIVGCGDLGQRVARVVGKSDWLITGVRRTPGAVGTDFPYQAADYSIPGSLDFAESLRPDFVLATFTPSTPDIEGYRRGFTAAAKNVLAGLGEHRVRRMIMVSSTRVYAEEAGGRVDEAGELSAQDERALAIIDAERKLLDSDQLVTIVRLAGIYGGQAGRLISRVARGQIAAAQPVRYTNRIHRDDCAGFLAHLFTLSSNNQPLSAVYNGVDDEPTPAHDVQAWLALEMGVELSAHSGDVQEAATLGKQCSNALLHSTGYELHYPDYRAGYRQVLGTL